MIRSLFISLVFVITTALPLRAGVDITEVETPGGFSAWLVEEPAIPFVALELSFRGGIALDPVGKEGVVNLMTALLEEGAGERDAQAFALAREELAAGISFDAYDDGISISVRYLSETQAEVMALLKTVFTDPRFDPDAVERVRGQVLANIRSEAQDPESIAGQAMAQLVYGDHPYARRENGTVETVTALTRDDLLAAHHATLAKDRVIISAVGDITEGELAKLIDDLLADLPETGA
ncbi:MAG: M16 family metallopeptidase, partial [Mangrovicoccus sp.]